MSLQPGTPVGQLFRVMGDRLPVQPPLPSQIEPNAAGKIAQPTTGQSDHQTWFMLRELIRFRQGKSQWLLVNALNCQQEFEAASQTLRAAGTSRALPHKKACPAQAVGGPTLQPQVPLSTSTPEELISQNKSSLPKQLKLNVKGGDATTVTRTINEWVQKTAMHSTPGPCKLQRSVTRQSLQPELNTAGGCHFNSPTGHLSLDFLPPTRLFRLKHLWWKLR